MSSEYHLPWSTSIVPTDIPISVIMDAGGSADGGSDITQEIYALVNLTMRFGLAKAQIDATTIDAETVSLTRQLALISPEVRDLGLVP